VVEPQLYVTHEKSMVVDGKSALAATGPMHEQLRRTVIAWSMVAMPGEQCVLWDLDRHVGVQEPWGIDLDLVEAIQADLEGLTHGI